MNPVSAANAEHYSWGSNCDGWYLVRTPELHIIEELMPPGTFETRHLHLRARQFFYVLEGELTMEVEGIEIASGKARRVRNNSAEATRILVTSQPQATATA